MSESGTGIAVKVLMTMRTIADESRSGHTLVLERTSGHLAPYPRVVPPTRSSWAPKFGHVLSGLDNVVPDTLTCTYHAPPQYPQGSTLNRKVREPQRITSPVLC